MSVSVPHHNERMVQLLADRATEGVEPTDVADLEAWLAMNPEVDPDAFDRAAAVVALGSA